MMMDKEINREDKEDLSRSPNLLDYEFTPVPSDEEIESRRAAFRSRVEAFRREGEIWFDSIEPCPEDELPEMREAMKRAQVRIALEHMRHLPSEN